MREIKQLGGQRVWGTDGRICSEWWQKALARWRKEKRWDKHHSTVATSQGGEKKQSSLEALTPSNPGHRRSLENMPSEEDHLKSPKLDFCHISFYSSVHWLDFFLIFFLTCVWILNDADVKSLTKLLQLSKAVGFWPFPVQTAPLHWKPNYHKPPALVTSALPPGPAPHLIPPHQLERRQGSDAERDKKFTRRGLFNTRPANQQG